MDEEQIIAIKGILRALAYAISDIDCVADSIRDEGKDENSRHIIIHTLYCIRDNQDKLGDQLLQIVNGEKR